MIFDITEHQTDVSHFVILKVNRNYKMKPAGRRGDIAVCPADAHGCKACSHYVKGPIVTGSKNVFINGKVASRVGDAGVHATCCGANRWSAASGSSTVFINQKQAHRSGDKTTHCGGSGTLTTGSSNVLVGDSASQAMAAYGSPQGDQSGPSIKQVD